MILGFSGEVKSSDFSLANREFRFGGLGGDYYYYLCTIERRQSVETPGAFLGPRVCNHYCYIELVDTNYTACVVPLRNRVIHIHCTPPPIPPSRDPKRNMPETTFKTSALPLAMKFDFLGTHACSQARARMLCGCAKNYTGFQ
jgi:hypothetical protein